MAEEKNTMPASGWNIEYRMSDGVVAMVGITLKELKDFISEARAHGDETPGVPVEPWILCLVEKKAADWNRKSSTGTTSFLTSVKMESRKVVSEASQVAGGV